VAALVADHVLVVGAGLWPTGRWLGPNLSRLGAAERRRGRVALTFDDGPDPEATPAVLDLLDRHRARATFFCVGERVARHPELAAEIVRRGHLVENHSHRHLRRFSLLGPGAVAREIDRAQAAIAAATGRLPRFFRPPAGLRNVFLEPLLARRGLWLASWRRRGFDTVSSDPRRVARALTRGLEPGDVLLLHDGGSARGPGGRPVVLDALPRVLEALDAAEVEAVSLDPPG
jgi:peptidoglycan/xylan/chitin deacetylase (PgdA/CDA1 family)